MAFQGVFAEDTVQVRYESSLWSTITAYIDAVYKWISISQ